MGKVLSKSHLPRLGPRANKRRMGVNTRAHNRKVGFEARFARWVSRVDLLRRLPSAQRPTDNRSNIQATKLDNRTSLSANNSGMNS